MLVRAGANLSFIELHSAAGHSRAPPTGRRALIGPAQVQFQTDLKNEEICSGSGALPFCGAANASGFNFTGDASFGSAVGTFEGILDVDGDTIIDMTDMTVELTPRPGVTNAGDPLAANGVRSFWRLVASLATVAVMPAGIQIMGGVAFGDPVIVEEASSPSNATVAFAADAPPPAAAPLMAGAFARLGLAGLRKRAHAGAPAPGRSGGVLVLVTRARRRPHRAPGARRGGGGCP